MGVKGIAAEGSARLSIGLLDPELSQRGIDHRHQRDHVAGVSAVVIAFDEHRMVPVLPQQLGNGDTGHTGADDEHADVVVVGAGDLFGDRGRGEHVWPFQIISGPGGPVLKVARLDRVVQWS